MYDNRTTLLDTITSYGGTLKVQTTSVRPRRFRHTSTSDWVRIWRDFIGLIIGVFDFIYCTTVGGKIPDVIKEGTEETCVHRRRKKETINEESTLTNKTSTLFYPRNHLFFLLFSLHSTLCCRGHPKARWKINAVSIPSIALQFTPLAIILLDF